MVRIRARHVVSVASSLLLLTCAGMVGAGSASAKADATLIVRDLPSTVRLIPGERVKITLSTNLTTGYSWTANGGCCTKSGAAIAKVSKGVYAAPVNNDGMVGMPGQTTWTVTALQPGTTAITIVTSPPGAQNTMNDETVGTLKLIVMPK